MATRTRRSGFTLTEVLTVVAIVGLAAALLIPAVQRAREKARHLQCHNNLKQIGLALHNYHESFGRLPSGFIGVDAQGHPEVSGSTGWGWAAMILPQLDQAPLFSSIDFRKPILDPANADVIHNQLPVFRCPSDTGADEFKLLASDGVTPLAMVPTSNYVGNFGNGDIDYCNNLVGMGVPCTSGFSLESHGVFFHNSSITLDSMLDGTSHTLLVSERSSSGNGSLQRTATWLGVIPGSEDAFALNLGAMSNLPSQTLSNDDGFSSFHPGVVDMLMADGHVGSVSVDTDQNVLVALASRDAGDGVMLGSGSNSHGAASSFGAKNMEGTRGESKRPEEPKMTTPAAKNSRGASTPAATPKAMPANQPGDPEWDDHFLFPLAGGGHGAWHGATPDTVGPIIIKYDFRSLNGFQNSITSAEKSVVQAAAQLWSDATCGKVQFQQDSAAPNAEIIIIGVGSLQAVGVPDDGQFGILGIGGGTPSGNEITSGFTWMDVNETWDTVIGNGDPNETLIDFYTVLAHEFGHSIGLGHLDDLPFDNMMNSIYNGEQTSLSQGGDIAVLELIYGTDCGGSGGDPDDPGSPSLPPGWIQTNMKSGARATAQQLPGLSMRQGVGSGQSWIFELRHPRPGTR